MTKPKRWMVRRERDAWETYPFILLDVQRENVDDVERLRELCDHLALRDDDLQHLGTCVHVAINKRDYVTKRHLLRVYPPRAFEGDLKRLDLIAEGLYWCAAGENTRAMLAWCRAQLPIEATTYFGAKSGIGDARSDQRMAE